MTTTTMIRNDDAFDGGWRRDKVDEEKRWDDMEWDEIKG